MLSDILSEVEARWGNAVDCNAYDKATGEFIGEEYEPTKYIIENIAGVWCISLENDKGELASYTYSDNEGLKLRHSILEQRLEGWYYIIFGGRGSTEKNPKSWLLNHPDASCIGPYKTREEARNAIRNRVIA